MKSLNFLVILSLALVEYSTAAPPPNEAISIPSPSNCEEPSGDHCEICEDEYVYECVDEWVHYELNDDPATDGLLVGDYLGNPIFVGRGVINGVLGANRIQITDPKGAYQVYGGSETYINDPARMWYLKRNPDHLYKWVVSKNGEKVEYGIDFGDCEIDDGYTMYITKVELEGSVTVGMASTLRKVSYYADLKKVMQTSKEYAVLTCRSKVYQPRPNCPTKPPSSTTPGNGCVTEWKPFIGNDAPAVDGVPAGLYENNDMLYVGATSDGSNAAPEGLLLNQPVENSFYLVQNPNYNYQWIDTEIGNVVPNAVKVALPDGASTFFYIGRIQVNGKMVIGTAGHPIGLFYVDKDGEGRFAHHFQVLVCDPKPACPCETNWIPYKNDMAPELDGFSFGIIKDHLNYIGRTVQKLPEGWSTVIGRVHPTHGVHYLNDASGREEVDEEDGEYLQKDPESIYSWITTHTDQQVRNAIKVPLRCENFTTCDVSCDSDSATGFIGKATIDGVTYVGTVYKNEGLVIADSCGSKMTLSNFEVLTCAKSGRCNNEERSCGNTDCGWQEERDIVEFH